MTKTLTMTLGLPGCGKSTWALEQVAKSKGQIKRVNKDDLRAMIDGGKWSKQNEDMVMKAQETLIGLYLGAGYSVIADSTNFGWQERFVSMARTYGADFSVKDFTDVPLETCIKNDLNRRASVGKDVIMRMYDQYLKPEPEVYEFTAGLPAAILVDVDGTLAHNNGKRGWYDWENVGRDDVDETIADLVAREHARGFQVVIMSGRDAACRTQTEEWLKEHDIPFDALFMRAAGDMRKDAIVKRELFDKFVRPHWNIKYALDDRNQVVDNWRQMGLKVLQVADGNF